MSRTGKNPVLLPAGTKVSLGTDRIQVEGKLGKLEMVKDKNVIVSLEKNEAGHDVVVVKPLDESKDARMMWGTTRALLNNLVEGVTKGYERLLEISGVGYRAKLEGKELVLDLGYSHEVRYQQPEGLTFRMDGNTKIYINGIDKQKVGQHAAVIRGFRPPEPYKGKGIRYSNEVILRKEGKKK